MQRFLSWRLKREYGLVQIEVQGGDRLNQLPEGTAFIARSAAKKRAKATGSGRVVVYPLAIRYREPWASASSG